MPGRLHNTGHQTGPGAKDSDAGVSPRKKPIIGLAGGIGAGKSSVARILKTLGAAVIDADRLSHEVLSEPEVVAMLRQWWGECVCTPAGEVDHQAIAAIVFDDPAELTRLENLLYPRITRRHRELLAAHTADPNATAIVLDAPKLFETGLNQLCDTVIFVDADWSVRVRRVGDSRGWNEAELARRENLQNPLDIKKANADQVVVNHSSIDVLWSQVERVFSAVLASFA